MIERETAFEMGVRWIEKNSDRLFKGRIEKPVWKGFAPIDAGDDHVANAFLDFREIGMQLVIVDAIDTACFTDGVGYFIDDTALLTVSSNEFAIFDNPGSGGVIIAPARSDP